VLYCAVITIAGLGGGGIYQTGFSIPQKFPEFYREQLSFRKWDVAVIMIGINDLLRGSTPAAEIMTGLQPLIDETLAKGVPIISIPPFAAPGFVAE
jgi:lysophospholipase L1-like esterase